MAPAALAARCDLHPQEVEAVMESLARFRCEKAMAALIAAGLPADTPAMAVQDGTTASQRVVAAGVGDLADAVAAAELKSPTLIFVGSVVSLLNKRDDAAAFGDALTEIKTRAAPVRVLTADGAQALLASVGAREGAADERDSRVEVM